MTRYFLLSLIGVYLAQSARIDTSQLLLADEHLANPRPQNEWTKFQVDYGGLDLALKEFSPLYRWDQRKKLEQQKQTKEYIIDLFRQTFAHLFNEGLDDLRMSNNAEVQAFANLGKLKAADVSGEIDPTLSSPLNIAKTLFDVIISHLPKAEIGVQFEKRNADGSVTAPFVDFIEQFRNGVEDRGLKGLLQRVSEWVVGLHMATQNYFTAKATGKGMSSMALAATMKRTDKNKAKEALKEWLDHVCEELNALASDEGEMVSAWMPMVSELHHSVVKAYEDRELNAELDKPIDLTLMTHGYLDGFSFGVNFLDNWFGAGEAPKAKTVHLTTIDDAFDHGYIQAELDEIQVNIEDLRVCFVELAAKLGQIRANFHHWKRQSLQNAVPEVRAANLDWAQHAWDELGIEIPGTGPAEPRECRQLRRMPGVIAMPLLPLGTAAATGAAADARTGFTYLPTGAAPMMLNYLYFNVANFLKGQELAMFIQLDRDAGPTVKIFLTSPAIPRLIPNSARTFTFSKVPSMDVFQPALGELSGLSGDQVNLAGSVWYKKEEKGKMLGMAKGHMEELAGAETGDPTPMELRSGGEDNAVFGEIGLIHGGVRAFCVAALAGDA